MNQNLLSRISIRTDVLGGNPTVRDLHISVALIRNLLSQGVSVEDLLEKYPELEREDILACQEYGLTLDTPDG